MKKKKEAVAKKPRAKKVKVAHTWEFEQDGVQYRKTYNAKGDVIKTEQL